MCLASKSSGGSPGDEASQGHAHDEDEDEAVAAGAHGGRAADGGRGQLREAVDLRKQRSQFKKPNQIRDVEVSAGFCL